MLVLPDNAQAARTSTPISRLKSPRNSTFGRAANRHVARQRQPDGKVDIIGGFTTTKHSGELPWGASFGFSNDNEVALPYKSRTNDMDVGLEWTNPRA